MRTVYSDKTNWPFASACPMFGTVVKYRTLRIYPDIPAESPDAPPSEPDLGSRKGGEGGGGVHLSEGNKGMSDVDANDAHLEASARKVDG